MGKNKLGDALYRFLVLYREGLTTQSVVDNKDIFVELSAELSKKNKNKCDVWVRFHAGAEELFEIKSSLKDDRLSFQIDITSIDFDDLSKLLFGQISCSDFLLRNSELVDNSSDSISFRELMAESNCSWDRFIERVGYNEDSFLPSDESKLAKSLIEEKHVLWCFNKSCTGKTYLGIKTLTYSNPQKFVYNPTVDRTCDLTVLKLLLEYGTDCAILIDDLQCDIELAKKLFQFIHISYDSITRRNVHIFLTSWSSLLQSKEFSAYSTMIPTITTKPQMFINILREKINNQALLDICGDNLALISAALQLQANKTDSNAAKSCVDDLFGHFVQTNDSEQIKVIYILAVLGTYEFESPISFIKTFGTLKLDSITTAKTVGESIFLAHRTISNFIARYIEQSGKYSLYPRKEIIKKYINFIDNRKKWNALIHLIGENDQTDILTVSPLWKLMYEFQNNLKRQTKIDPSWDNTPSSMYFVISVANMLGVVDEYRDVIDALFSHFPLRNETVDIQYDSLKTTTDFIKIKEKMIEEDECSPSRDYERGDSIDLSTIHKNWLFGLLIGLKAVATDYGYQKLIDCVEKYLLSSQDESGYWYPKRVPWVTARIMIGLAEAGYSIKDDCIKKGAKYLTSVICDGKWEAHTGGWNNTFETSSLCLEALIKCGVDCNSDLIQEAAKYLLDNSSIWMSANNEIDGSTASCTLLKIVGVQSFLLQYIKELANRNIHDIVDATNTLDYNVTQSCETTQIAYYVIELCWYILEKDIPSLLDDFIARSESGMEDRKVQKEKIFISYSEDSKYHIKRIARIVDFLRNEGYIVYFYSDAPLGTNNMEFMQRINQCDATIVIGTKQYKKKSMEIKTGGVFFEACVLSREFMNNNYEKIIPVAFDDFNDSFPEPFAINKGVRVKRVDDSFLKTLSIELKNKF